MAELAGRQHGIVTREQLLGLGLGRSAIGRRVAAGHLHPLHRGVYAVGHACVPKPGRYLAAVVACGPGAALSHRPAADLLGLRRSSGRIHVTVPRARAGPTALIVHRSRMVEPRDFTVREGIRVTSVVRTLLDLAELVTATELARAVDRAERLEVFDLSQVEELLVRARGRRGATALRRAIAGWYPRHTRSELEDRFAELLSATELPQPRLNVLLQGERAAHEVDAFWPADALVVQLDGFAYHHTRRDHERDAATNGDLELAGYRVLRLTWNDVTVHGSRTVRRLHRILNPRAQ